MYRCLIVFLFSLYFSVANRTSPSSYIYTRSGSKLVTQTYTRRSYFSPLIVCGCAMYFEYKYPLCDRYCRFFTGAVAEISLMPRPQELATGFRIQ